jgi:hypothetical protein
LENFTRSDRKAAFSKKITSQSRFLLKYEKCYRFAKIFQRFRLDIRVFTVTNGFGGKLIGNNRHFRPCGLRKKNYDSLLVQKRLDADAFSRGYFQTFLNIYFLQVSKMQ